MAARQANINTALIKKYIDTYAADLTRRANVNALANPNADDRAALGSPTPSIER